MINCLGRHEEFEADGLVGIAFGMAHLTGLLQPCIDIERRMVERHPEFIDPPVAHTVQWQRSAGHGLKACKPDEVDRSVLADEPLSETYTKLNIAD